MPGLLLQPVQRRSLKQYSRRLLVQGDIAMPTAASVNEDIILPGCYYSRLFLQVQYFLYTLYSISSMVCSVFPLYSVQYFLYSRYSISSILCTVFPLYSVQYFLYCLYSISSILHTVFPLHFVQYFLYTPYKISSILHLKCTQATKMTLSPIK